MAIKRPNTVKMPPKKPANKKPVADVSTEKVENWIKQGKDADTKVEQEVKARKQISVYLNDDLIQDIKVMCVTNRIKLNDFYESAITTAYKKFIPKNK